MKRIIVLSCLFVSGIAYAQQDSLGMTKLGQYTYNSNLNDIWGYADGNGNEYALVGLSNGFSIVDVTDPANPEEEHFITGAPSTWRDIKTWSHYAYVVHDNTSGGASSDGILIVDLDDIEANNIDTTHFYPTVTVDSAETYSTSHNLYIDENGVLYVFGSNIGVGGALMFDVAADPLDPPLLGVVNSIYYHDGVARGDTLWGAGITTGIFQVVDVQNKINPVLLGTQATPHNFTHNIWFSDDNQTVFTTDEKKGAFITAYDVSDMNNITELDRIRTTIYDPQEVIPHNVHVKGDFLVTSYYTSGVQIVDASQPDNLVETAYYDTSPLQGNGYNGAWGAYPYLPSGLILVSDIQEGLIILDTDYPRAAFFTAHIQDRATGGAVVNARIEILNTDISGTSNIFGNFRDGQRDTGTYQVVVSKSGYYTDTISVKLSQGVVTAETIVLTPKGFSIGENGYKTGLDVFPNPSQGQVSISLPQLNGSQVELTITDVKGQIVHRATLPAIKRIELQTELEPGVYLLSVVNGEDAYVPQRLVVHP